ncbi:hypothetical protein [Ammoniphilus sp. 3BR4]|uniref:hypothetical protein n=1 Tax=Ammoniphilus sp. 3BR4 TaxID=3158265 RepID=UPI003464F751
MIGIIIAGFWMEPSHTSTMALKEQLEISPADVFEGDAIKLRPHLGLTTGAVGVRYNGSKEFISTSYKIWEKGKRISQNASMSSTVKSPFQGEVSVSLQDASPDLNNQKFKGTIVISSETGYSSSTFFIDKFDPLVSEGYGPRNWNKTLLVDDDREVAIWGLFASDSFSTSESLEEQAQKADWAFLLKLKMEDEISAREK